MTARGTHTMWCGKSSVLHPRGGLYLPRLLGRNKLLTFFVRFPHDFTAVPAMQKKKSGYRGALSVFKAAGASESAQVVWTPGLQRSVSSKPEEKEADGWEESV